MACALSADVVRAWLRLWQVRSMPIRKDDEIKVIRGKLKTREGKVVQVYRKKFIIHVQGLSKEKSNGASAARQLASRVTRRAHMRRVRGLRVCRPVGCAPHRAVERDDHQAQDRQEPQEHS